MDIGRGPWLLARMTTKQANRMDTGEHAGAPSGQHCQATTAESAKCGRMEPTTWPSCLVTAHAFTAQAFKERLPSRSAP